MNNQVVVILDFGSQYRNHIARNVRDCGVYSVILPWNTPAQTIREIKPIGIIFSGGPNSAYLPGAPMADPAILDMGVPILGICYGMQMMCQMLGGQVARCRHSENGAVMAQINPASVLFSGTPPKQQVLMSHSDEVIIMPEGFVATAKTDLCEIAAYECKEKQLFGVQYHPEVEHSIYGKYLISHFLYTICHAVGDYSMQDYLKAQIEEVRSRVSDKKVLLALSGGLDSAVTAALLHEAIPGQLLCVYVDNGLMRAGESEEVCSTFAYLKDDFLYVDAKDEFLDALRGITCPEEKRRIVGKVFAHTFEKVAKEHGPIAFLAQGTIYADVIESGTKQSALIKTHHNVGGLPKNLKFEGVIEPLASLFKDEVKKLGQILNLPKRILSRQPFPGPGLAIRIIGEVTEEKLNILRHADAIFTEEMKRCRSKPNQYFCVLTDTRSVGVTGDFRTYEYTLALRAIETSDFMTCDFARLNWSFLARVSSRITTEVKSINRVVYDITSKPPATIEWE